MVRSGKMARLFAAALPAVGLIAVAGARDEQPDRAVAGTSEASSARWVSANPAISAQGRFVAFDSSARLVRADTNDARDVYVRDRATGALRRVSVAHADRQAARNSVEPAMSGNGRWIAFTSRAKLVPRDGNGARDVYVRDRSARTTHLVSAGSGGAVDNGPSYDARSSSDGTSVAFSSDASNLVAGDSNH